MWEQVRKKLLLNKLKLYQKELGIKEILNLTKPNLVELKKNY
jgi:hypothetical protein